MAEKERLYFELIFTATDVGCFLNLWNYGIGCHNLFRENKIKKPPCQKKVSVLKLVGRYKQHHASVTPYIWKNKKKQKPPKKQYFL